MTDMDLVWIVRPGTTNEELRHSMRSACENLPHRLAWVVGDCPLWVSDEVGWIRTAQIEHRHRNARDNIRAACESEHISERFVLMNDDFFILKPLAEVPTLHRGTIDEFVAPHRKAVERGGMGWWARAVETKETLVRLGWHPDEILSYELHVPMVVDRALMLRAIAELESIGRDGLQCATIRSFYGNYARVGGRKVNDCKVNDEADWKQLGGAAGVSGWPFLSTSDSSWRYAGVGVWLRSRFPTASKFEKE